MILDCRLWTDNCRFYTPSTICNLNPNVADLLRRAAQALAARGKNALECAPAEGGTAHRLGQDEAHFTVREILAEASTAADGVLQREPSDFSRCGFATLG
jgi:hypothetical protein